MLKVPELQTLLDELTPEERQLAEILSHTVSEIPSQIGRMYGMRPCYSRKWILAGILFACEAMMHACDKSEEEEEKRLQNEGA